MPSGAPPSPISVLALDLTTTLALQGVRILAGARNLAQQGAPPRIVLFPQEGAIGGAMQVDTAIRDVELQVAARIWGQDLDGAWDLRTRLFQGLEQISLNADKGFFYKAQSEIWDDVPDSSKQGQEVQVLFMTRFAIERAPQATGLVSVLSYSQSS